MILNATNLRSLYIGYSAAFQAGLGSAVSTYENVAMVVPSTTRTQEYGWLGQMPRIREWIGERVIQGLSTYGYAIRNRPWELTLGVEREDIEDDNIGVYAPIFADLGRAAKTFPDELVWPLLAAGFTSPCYDGQYFFDVDHPVLDKNGTVVSVSNFGGGSGTAWYLIDRSRGFKPIIFQQRKPFEFVRMDAPTDEVVFDRKQYRYGLDGRCNAGYGFWQIAYASKQTLDTAGYGAARAAMGGMLADYGRPLGLLTGAKPLLIVPPSLETQARTLLNAERNASGATNIWRDTADLLITPWIS